MARAARTAARRHAALVLLLAGLVAGGLATAPAARGQSAPGPAAAPPDTTALLAQASGTASPSIGAGSPPAAPGAAATTEPGAGFTLRRIANPRYRIPIAPSELLARPLGTLIGTQFMRAQITRRGISSGNGSTDWELAAGRDAGDRHHVELWAQGYSSPQYDQLRLLRFTSRQNDIAWSVGDLLAEPVGMLAWLQRLRGASLTHALARGSDWRVLGGVVPTLTHGESPNSGVAGVLFDRLPMASGAFSLGLLGFGRTAPDAGVGRIVGPDSLAGGGGSAVYAAHMVLGHGELGTTFMAQVHTLDGAPRLAGIQALEWTLSRPGLVAAVRDQIGTTNARQPGTVHLSQAPSHEARASAQMRMLGGRAEVHLAGLTSAGTDIAYAAETVQLGTSGSLGGSGWYTGFDFSWNRRAPLLDDERRISAQTGRVSDRGNSLLMRLERSADNHGRNQLQFTGEAAATPFAGLRVALEPRLTWETNRLDRGMISTRLAWPLLRGGLRLNGSVTVAAERGTGFRDELSEASLAMSFAPRGRDRAGLEAHRYQDAGVRSLDYTASYDMQGGVYSNPAGPADARTGTLTVTVTRADSVSGVADVLVDLDGKEFRFTDGDGVARFTNLDPGSHVVSIVERSLPAAQRVVGSATAFVTVERGRVPEPIRFEIARPVRRVRF